MTQDQALEILKSGHNIYLTGAAGSGKTYLLNEYIRFLKDRGIGVGITASTGIAATHIGGLTIHAWAGIGVKRTASSDEVKMMAADKRVAGRFRRTDVLLIDEISMLDADRLDLVEHIARFARGNFEPFGGLQVILCGDFFQLPPVAKEGETPPRFAYCAAAWKALDLKICYLHEQYRQGDRELLEVLHAIRGANVSEKTIVRLEARRDGSLGSRRVTKLYSHNIDVDEENARELDRLMGEETRYAMQSRGASALVAVLKKGCFTIFPFISLRRDGKNLRAKPSVLSSYDSMLSGLNGSMAFTNSGTGSKVFTKITMRRENFFFLTSLSFASVTKPSVPCEPTISFTKLNVVLSQTFQSA